MILRFPMRWLLLLHAWGRTFVHLHTAQLLRWRVSVRRPNKSLKQMAIDALARGFGVPLGAPAPADAYLSRCLDRPGMNAGAEGIASEARLSAGSILHPPRQVPRSFPRRTG
jgi:hypothetical protein